MRRRSKRSMGHRTVVVSAAVLLAWSLAVETQQRGGQGQPQQQQGGRGRGGLQRPARDARPTPAGTASISGRVFAADTGRPVKRARVFFTGGGRPFAAVTDEQGRFQVTGLPAASYNITAAKAGFVDTAFGQRRTLRSGAPVTLADGQQLGNVDIRLPRGGVITGRVGDEDGEPLARATISVMRYQYVRGERQLMAAGVDQTDDRGEYRVFGLAPGEYVVSATAGGAVEQLLRTVMNAAGAPDSQPAETVGYAPTYYPGAVTAADAMRVKVAAAQQVENIDFQVQLVPLATVSGIVNGANAIVVLVPEGGALGGGGRGGGRGGLAELATGVFRGTQPLRATVQSDGTFAIRNVPPGSYTIVARTDMGTGAPKTAVQALAVAGGDVQVALTPAPGATLSGAITLESSRGALPQGFGGFRVNPQPLGAAVALPGGRGGTPNDRGEFSIANLMPGRYGLRATGPRGWTMKAVYADGREVTDDAIDVKGDHISGVNVIFTDRVASVSGTVRDGRGAPAANVTVVAFTDDERLWYPQSRHVVAARTDANGVYRLSALPPGQYLIVAVEDVEQGEWFDPAFLSEVKGGAARLAIGDGEQKTQDLRGPSSPAPSHPF